MALSLVVGFAPLSRARAAQSRLETRAGEGSGGAGKTKVIRFEVVSIRPSGQRFGGQGLSPDGFRTAIRMWQLVLYAYGPKAYGHWPTDPGLLQNGPAWLGDWYQIDARISNDDVVAWGNQSRYHELLRGALRAMLAERCNLVLHEQTITVPVYNLVARKKLGLKATAPGSVLPTGGVKLPTGAYIVPTGAIGQNWYGATMDDLAAILNDQMHHPVRNMTGLTGHYDFSMHPDHEMDRPSHDYEGDPQLDYRNEILAKLGLELKPGRGPDVNLVIDHIEKPSPN
ncbi:MAG TPA: TIGR03435 family protein [Acidobacteriaceae bacterium]|nr:TIGR03435 family protein [Acidobacteriaceae bacterium]